MNSNIENKRSFIIKFVYLAIWAGIIFCFLKFAMPLFMPFVVAFCISFFLKPLINKISQSTPLTRKLTAILVLVFVYAAIISLLVFAGVRLTIFLRDWFIDLPRLYSESIEPAVAAIVDNFDGFMLGLNPGILEFLETANENISNGVSSFVTSISSWALGYLGGIASAVPWLVVATFLTIIASFFFVVDYYKIAHFIASQFSENGRRRLFLVKDYVVNVLFKFFRAYGIIILITFSEVSLGLLVLGVPHPFLVAAVTAIVDIIPVLGTGTIMIPWALYALLVSQNYVLGIGLIVLYAVITVIRQVIEPRIVGGQIGLYPLLTLICMFIGVRLFGFWGLLGFPIALTVIIYLNNIGELSIFKPHDSSAVPFVPQKNKKGDKNG